MAVGENELSEYWALLREIEQLAFTDLNSLLRQLDGEEQAALWAGLRAGVPEIVNLYRSTAADTAMLFYENTQGLAFDREAALAASAVNAAQLEKQLRWAVFAAQSGSMGGNLAAVVQKQVLDGSRHYAMSGFVSAGSGWYRAAQPGACAFCRMLATRSATEWGPYGSAAAGVFIGQGRHSRSTAPPETKFHKNCHCIPVLASEYEVPEHVNEWTEEYYKATEAVGNASDTKLILSEMRRTSGHSH